MIKRTFNTRVQDKTTFNIHDKYMIKRTFNTHKYMIKRTLHIKQHLTHKYMIKRTFNTQVHDKTNI